MGDQKADAKTVLESVTNEVAGFVDNIVLVFSHTKNDVIEQLDKWNMEVLINLRCVLFRKFVEIFPQYKEQELISRRSKQLLTEDVYIIGYSVINKKEDRRFKNILKGEMPSEVTASPEIIDINRLYETCLELQEMVDILKVRVNGHEKRIEELEDENTRLKLTLVEKIEKTDEKQAETSTDHTELLEDENTSPNKLLKTQSQTEDKKTNEKVEKDEKEKEEPFRHTTAYRRKILKAKEPNCNCKQQKSDSNRSAVLGTSIEQHRIKSAVPGYVKQATSLVYIGGLDQNTSEDEVWSHILDIGVQNRNIADVLKLKNRSNSDASFCVSICNKEAEDLVYNSSKWPSGTRIRPFKKKPNHANRRGFSGQRQQRAPRFRRQSPRWREQETDWQGYEHQEEARWRPNEEWNQHRDFYWSNDDQHSQRRYEDCMDYFRYW